MPSEPYYPGGHAREGGGVGLDGESIGIIDTNDTIDTIGRIGRIGSIGRIGRISGGGATPQDHGDVRFEEKEEGAVGVGGEEDAAREVEEDGGLRPPRTPLWPGRSPAIRTPGLRVGFQRERPAWEEAHRAGDALPKPAKDAWLSAAAADGPYAWSEISAWTAETPMPLAMGARLVGTRGTLILVR